VRLLLLARYARLNQKAEDENENDDEDDWGRKRERVRPRAHAVGIPGTAEAGGLSARQEHPDSPANGDDRGRCGVTESLFIGRYAV